MKDIRKYPERLSNWMKVNGYSEETRRRYTAMALALVNEVRQDPSLSFSLAAEKCLARYVQPSGRLVHQYNRIAKRLLEIQNAGKPSYSIPTGLRSEYFRTILFSMRSWDGWTSRGAGMNGYWRGSDFFKWLESRGYSNLADLNLHTVREYAAAKAESFICQRAFRHGMRLLFRYLNATGICRFDIKPFLSFGSSSRTPLLPAFDINDASRLLASFDTSTTVGKRDFAFVMLAMTTGLRSGDLCRIVLTDFDWQSGTLNLVQQKTGKPISVPLTPGASEAVRDYILNGRDNVQSTGLFLTATRPQVPVARHTMSSRFMDLCLAAGIDRKPGDGKSLHSLRRLLGVALSKNDVPVTMVAQVLGHSSVHSSERYLAIDGQTLSDCPLGFDGIKPEGLSWN